MIARVLLLLVAAAASASAWAAADPARYMDAKLVAETDAPKPGSTVLVGFRFMPKPGWHGYWSNPGDSGIAPTVHWAAPDGVAFGPLLHPAPTLLSADGISSFVHEGPHVLLSRMTVAPSVAPGTPIPVKAQLSWAACTATQCVPLRATFTLDLVPGDGARGDSSKVLQAAASKLPRPAADGTFVVRGDRLQLRLPPSARIDAGKARFFPDTSGAFNAALQSGSVESGATVIGAVLTGDAPTSLGGVVSDGRNACRLSFRPAAAEPAATESKVTPAAPEPQPAQTASAQRRPPPPAPAPPRNEPRETDWWWLALLAGAAVGAGVFLLRRRD